MTNEAGISNRMTPEDEAKDRREHPPEQTGPPPVEDAAGRAGGGDVEPEGERQTSHKAGSRSVAQKEAGSRHADSGSPDTRPAGGAFGKEPSRATDDA